MTENQSPIRELWKFIKHEKKFWLVPLILVVVGLGLLLVIVEGSPLTPFLYPLF